MSNPGGFIPPHIQLVLRMISLGGKAAAAWRIPSLPSVKVNNSFSYVLTPPDEFVASCLINHRAKLSWKKGIFRSKDERIWRGHRVLCYEIPSSDFRVGGDIWIHGGGSISSNYNDIAADVAQDGVLISLWHKGMSKQRLWKNHKAGQISNR